jgi:hypothetical protein
VIFQEIRDCYGKQLDLYWDQSCPTVIGLVWHAKAFAVSPASSLAKITVRKQKVVSTPNTHKKGKKRLASVFITSGFVTTTEEPKAADSTVRALGVLQDVLTRAVGLVTDIVLQ